MCFNIIDGTRDVVVEEIIDGANVGISIIADEGIATPNRSHYVSSGDDHVQFNSISAWIEEYGSYFVEILTRENTK